MRKEFQVKVLGTIDLSLLLSLGAEPLGQITQKDIYLAGEKTWRIREEAGQYVFAQKSHDIGQRARVKDVEERIIAKAEADRLVKQKGVRVVVFKNRTLYRLNESVITIDEVEHLGDFTEIRSTGEKELFRILSLLGIRESEAIKESYLDLMVQKALPKWLRMVLRVHEKVGEMTFGVISGVLTTSGVLVGMESATSSRLSVIAAILTVAIADSCSDAFGIYMSKRSERGGSQGTGCRYALGTLMGKFVLPLTFIAPLLLFTLEKGVWVALGWGAVVLTLLSLEGAVVRKESSAKVVACNLGLGIFIVLLSWFAGSALANLG